MSRTLLILRHGKSSWKDETLSDFDRPLAKRGRRDVPRIADWLCAHEELPDVIVTSPARRAVETAERFCDALGRAIPLRYDERVYDATCSELLRVVADAPVDAPRVMLVGHNPGLEELVEDLCGAATPSPEGGKLLPTAALIGLEMPDDWTALSRGRIRARWCVRPKSLSRSEGK